MLHFYNVISIDTVIGLVFIMLRPLTAHIPCRDQLPSAKLGCQDWEILEAASPSLS